MTEPAQLAREMAELYNEGNALSKVGLLEQAVAAYDQVVEKSGPLDDQLQANVVAFVDLGSESGGHAVDAGRRTVQDAVHADGHRDGSDHRCDLREPAKTKIVLLVADGLGGLPLEPGGLTELETASTPNLDACARDGVTGLSIPVLPGITDSLKQLEAVVKAAATAKTAHIYANPLFLKPCSAAVFLPFLSEHFPQLVPDYEKRFKDRAFLPTAYRKRISALITNLRAKYGIYGESRWTAEDAPSAETQLKLF